MQHARRLLLLLVSLPLLMALQAETRWQTFDVKGGHFIKVFSNEVGEATGFSCLLRVDAVHEDENWNPVFNLVVYDTNGILSVRNLADFSEEKLVVFDVSEFEDTGNNNETKSEMIDDLTYLALKKPQQEIYLSLDWPDDTQLLYYAEGDEEQMGQGVYRTSKPFQARTVEAIASGLTGKAYCEFTDE